MLTTKQIARALAGIDKPGTRGLAASLRRTVPQYGPKAVTAKQRQFLSDLAALPQGTAITYAHPGNEAAAGLGSRARGEEPLTPAELAWLSRLPTTPAEVPYRDASRVLTIAGAVKKPDEKMLVDSIADPIREHHDRMAAAASLMSLDQPLTPIPPSALGAMADAIANEQPELHPHEALGRASDAIDQIHADRVAAREARRQLTQRQLDAIEANAADRTALAR